MRVWIALAIAGIVFGLQGIAMAIDSLDPDDAKHDDDGDGLINLLEFAHGTDPTNPDTDGGGVPDGWEVYYNENRATYDPFSNDFLIHNLWCFYARYDSNGDEISDVNIDPEYKFNPTCREDEKDGSRGEVDSDLWSNLQEYLHGTDPTNPDTDKDRYLDDIDPQPLIYTVEHDTQTCCTQPVIPFSGQGPKLPLQGAGLSEMLGASWESLLIRAD